MKTEEGRRDHVSGTQVELQVLVRHEADERWMRSSALGGRRQPGRVGAVDGLAGDDQACVGLVQRGEGFVQLPHALV